MVELSVIIVNYKNPKRANRCIDSIKSSGLDNIDYEIIVVDNASKDDSKKVITEAHKDVKYIQSDVNLGMGEGNNLGIKNSEGEYILITNDDVIFKKDSIKNLLEYFKKHSDIGILGPRTLNSDETFQQSYFRFPPVYKPFIRRTFLGKIFKKSVKKFLMKDFDGSYTRDVDWIRGSCLLTSKKVLKVIGGGFDKRFWMYFEDIDLCKRIWENNLRVIYFFDSDVIHDHGHASAEGKWYFAPFTNKLARAHIISWLKYFWKWGLKGSRRK